MKDLYDRLDAKNDQKKIMQSKQCKDIVNRCLKKNLRRTTALDFQVGDLVDIYRKQHASAIDDSIDSQKFYRGP